MYQRHYLVAIFAACAIAVLPAITACKSTNAAHLADASTDADSLASTSAGGAPRPKLELCAAVRGNGNYVFTHWGALARILEHYGPIDGMAGGSSASASTFLYESIYMNPAVWDCPDGRCSEREAAIRMAYLVKSLRGFIAVIGDRVDFSVASAKIPVVLQRFKNRDYTDIVASGDLDAAAKAAARILASPELGGVIDKRLVPRLEKAAGNPAALKVLLGEIQGAVNAFNWDSSKPEILIERGLIDFEELARRAGIAADFYAGKDPLARAQTKDLLDACADNANGYGWQVASEFPGPDLAPAGDGAEAQHQSCGEFYGKIANGFYDRFVNADHEPARLSDPVGTVIPSLISTSVYVSPDADAHLRKVYGHFLAGEPYERGFSSDWIRFGYWGQAEDLNRVQRNEQGFLDLKSSRFLPLGPMQWGEALRVGPQEPGLGSVLCNYDQGSSSHRGLWDSLSNLPEGQACKRWSLGAWSDLYPTQVLKNLGCERVIYVTRQDDEGSFVKGVVKLLTKDDDDWNHMEHDFFDLDNPASSAAVGVATADAAACSDWDMIAASQVDCLQQNAYESPINSKDPFFHDLKGNGPRGARLRAAGFQPYEAVRAAPPLRGCVAGAPKSEGAKRPNPCPPDPSGVPANFDPTALPPP